MLQIKRIALIEAILIIFIIVTGASATVTEARYRSQVAALDQARVARPRVRLLSQNPSTDLIRLEPGTSFDYEFSVENTSTEGEVSEVVCEYEIFINLEGPQPTDLTTVLYLWSETGDWLQCPQYSGDCYLGAVPLGTTPVSHKYKLTSALSADATPGSTVKDYSVWITVNARQSDL